MEVVYTPTTQTLTLMPRASHSSFCPSRIHSIRRQFLGCGLTFRNPPLRSRRKCKKVQRTRIVAASVDSELILVSVAAAAAAAAAALLYFNYYLIRKKKIKAEVIATFPVISSVIHSWI
ncbi:hypothetical protein Dimus_002605 [Dionaea muscipula]